MREFFGFGGYQREPEGYFSAEHLLFVTTLMVIMITVAVLLGIRNRNASFPKQNGVLVVSAVLIDALEIFKIVLCCFRAEDAMNWVYNLPLFLCSIQLITIPLAAFSSGRLKEASLDFVAIFGILGAIMGTYFAGQNYGCYPVLSFDNVVSGLTHSIAGFVSLYVLITGMAKLHTKNIPITCSVLGGFCIAAYIANLFTDSNYMFLSRGDGTPYDIAYDLVNGNTVAYPLFVVGLFLVYISLFYAVFRTLKKHT